MKSNPLPSVDRLRTVLRYEPSTGSFHWLRSTTNKTVVGSPAGSVNSKGYVLIQLDGKKFKAHRLAWLFVTGEDPMHMEIDHIDRDKTNNAWANLRLADRKLNNENIDTPRHNTSGSRGISFNKKRGLWEAYIYSDKKRRHLGYFGEFSEARAVRTLAERRFFHGIGTQAQQEGGK